MCKNSITITFKLIHQIVFAKEYKFTKEGKCFNTKTGRKIKKVSTKSGCIGYNIKGRFRSLKYLSPKLEKIPKQTNLPF